MRGLFYVQYKVSKWNLESTISDAFLMPLSETSFFVLTGITIALVLKMFHGN